MLKKFVELLGRVSLLCMLIFLSVPMVMHVIDVYVEWIKCLR